MQELSKTPLVDVLSEQQGRRVVVSGNDYVYLDTKEKVEQTKVDEAIIKNDNNFLALLKEDTYNKLQTLCDTKSQEAKNYINGAKVTDELLEEYEIKVQLAKNYKQNGLNTEELQLEADLIGKTVDELATLILQLNDQYCEAYNKYKMMIGAFRVKVKHLIASGQLEEANRTIEAAKSFDISTTSTEIRSLFV